MNTNSHHATAIFPPKAVADNVRNVQADALSLLQLQAELLQADLSDCRRELRWPARLLVVSLMVGTGSVPVALAGVALGLQEMTELSLAAALLITGGGMCVIAALGGAVVYRRMRRAATVFQRSGIELQRNMNWLKQLFTRSKPPSRVSG